MFNTADTAEELPIADLANEGTIETIGTERSELKQYMAKISSKAMLNSMIGNKNGKSNDPDENN